MTILCDLWQSVHRLYNDLSISLNSFIQRMFKGHPHRRFCWRSVDDFFKRDALITICYHVNGNLKCQYCYNLSFYHHVKYGSSVVCSQLYTWWMLVAYRSRRSSKFRNCRNTSERFQASHTDIQNALFVCYSFIISLTNTKEENGTYGMI